MKNFLLAAAITVSLSALTTVKAKDGADNLIQVQTLDGQLYLTNDLTFTVIPFDFDAQKFQGDREITYNVSQVRTDIRHAKVQLHRGTRFLTSREFNFVKGKIFLTIH